MNGIYFIILRLFSCLFLQVAKAQELKDEYRYQEYPEIIPDSAVSQKGLFSVHRVGDIFYFEIPESILEREILIATKLSCSIGELLSGAGGQPRSQQIIRFRRKGNFILIQSVNYTSTADPQLPIYQSVTANNSEAVLFTFKIEALGKKGLSYVVKVNDMFTSNLPVIGGVKEYDVQKLGISGVDKSRSSISWVRAFPDNVEVRHLLTYAASNLPDNNLGSTISIELNQSFILLPADPMVPRIHDERVGFFSVEQLDYGLEEQKTILKKYITRWRLVPADWDSFNRGILVKPVKPIVYYIDPATPQKWRNYIKRGVEEWVGPFEKIGFKEAIIVKDAPSPTEDSVWNPEDIRYSVIRWQARKGQSANAQKIYDPRTGEILESDIVFQHGMMNLLKNWFFVRTAAINPRARRSKIEDEEMGQLIQTVITHEVGHTLGLMHNSVPCSAYPIDSLRSPSFISRHGLGGSIMRFTFNYVAQPGDSISNFHNKLGDYDYWAICYGYKPLPNVYGAEMEKSILEKWVDDKSINPIFKYGVKTFLLGSDQLQSAELATANLRRIMLNIIDWSGENGNTNVDVLSDRYNELLREFETYLYAVVGLIENGNSFTDSREFKNPGNRYRTIERQKEVIAFLDTQLFKTPYWLADTNVLQFLGSGDVNPVKKLQSGVLTQLMNVSIKVMENEALYGVNSYSLANYFSDIRESIFKELISNKPIDSYRRDLQKMVIDHLLKLANSNDQFKNTDLPSVAIENLIIIKRRVEVGIRFQRDDISRFHLKDLKTRIEKSLENYQK